MYPLPDTSDQDEGKTYSEMAKMRSKATICRRMKKKDKTVCQTKEKYLATNQALSRRDWKLFL